MRRLALLLSLLAACDNAPGPADATPDAPGPDAGAFEAGTNDAGDASDAGPPGDGAAGVVVQFSDGTVGTACVDLPGGVSNSFDVIAAAGLGAVTDGASTVCKIGADGCDFPTESCLCQCTAPCRVWGLYRLSGGQWVAAGGNPATNAVHPGDVDGWTWGTYGGMTMPPLPPATTFADLCPGR